jgi:hypothetical protein
MIRPMASNVSALSSVVAKGHQAIHLVSYAPAYHAVRRVFSSPVGSQPRRSCLRQSLPQPGSPSTGVCYHYSVRPSLAEAGLAPASMSKIEGCTQEHVPFQNIFQSISSGPGYALRRQPGGPECGGSSHSGRSYRGRRSYELSQCQLIRRCVGLSIGFLNILKYLVFRRSRPPGGRTLARRVSASNEIKRKRQAEVARNHVPPCPIVMAAPRTHASAHAPHSIISPSSRSSLWRWVAG